jgi:AraC-like DNA-binding protein
VLESNPEQAILAKCLNYYYETISRPNQPNETVEAVGLLLYPEIVSELFDGTLQQSHYTVPYNLKQIQVNQLLAHYRESIDILLDNPELADEELIKNKLREFVILMTKTVGAPSELDFLASMFKPNFVRFEEVIQHNLYANLSLKELADLCHMSLATFKREFKKVYQESPAKYMSKMRISKAAQALKNPEIPISHVAYDVGYDSLTTFNRSFKEHMGQTPTQYRLSLSA